MITSPQAYERTKQLLVSLSKDRDELFKASKEIDNSYKYEVFGIESMISDLENELQDYNDILSRRINFDIIESLDDMPRYFIGKRLQLGISPQTLANKIGLSIEQYSGLERNNFYGITAEVFHRLLDNLGINDKVGFFSSDPETYVDKAEKTIIDLKIKRSFVKDMMSISFNAIRELLQTSKDEGAYMLELLRSTFIKVFSIDLNKTLTSRILEDSYTVAFKHRTNIDRSQLTIVTSFAVNVAWIVAKKLEANEVNQKADPIEVRRLIIQRYKKVTLETCLEFIWDLGVPVIPYNIRKGFHGAAISFENRKVICLNQQNRTASRWKFDLLHEIYHIFTMENNTYIGEATDIATDSDNENNASLFACFVIFGKEVDSFFEKVLENCGGSMENIKYSITSVAAKYALDVDDFSNYVAYQLSKQRVNIWGVASNLQNNKSDPLSIARDAFYRHISSLSIGTNDLLLIQKALAEREIV